MLRRSLTLLTIAAWGIGAETQVAPAPVPVPALAPRTLTLAKSIELSAATVPISISRLEVAISKAGYGAERMAYLPNISATAGLSRRRGYQGFGDTLTRVPPTNDLNGQLQLGQAILDLEAWHRIQAADRQLAADEAASTVALEDAAAGAGQAYVNLVGDQALVQVRTEDLRLAQELLTQATAQVEAGTAEAIAETRAANRLQAAKSALTTANGQVRRSQIALARALDLDPAGPLLAGEALDDTLAAGVDTDTAKAERTALAVRPELRVSRETLASLEQARQAARGRELPRLDAFAAGGRGGIPDEATEKTWSVGLSLTIPLVDDSGYRTEQATLQVAQENLRLRQLHDRIRAEVRDALAVIETAAARLVSDQEGRRLAEEELKQARARFDAGAAGNLEVIDAQRGLSLAQEAVVVATQALVQARVRLARAVGSATALR